MRFFIRINIVMALLILFIVTNFYFTNKLIAQDNKKDQKLQVKQYIKLKVEINTDYYKRADIIATKQGYYKCSYSQQLKTNRIEVGIPYYAVTKDKNMRIIQEKHFNNKNRVTYLSKTIYKKNKKIKYEILFIDNELVTQITDFNKNNSVTKLRLFDKNKKIMFIKEFYSSGTIKRYIQYNKLKSIIEYEKIYNKNNQLQKKTLL